MRKRIQTRGTKERKRKKINRGEKGRETLEVTEMETELKKDERKKKGSNKK